MLPIDDKVPESSVKVQAGGRAQRASKLTGKRIVSSSMHEAKCVWSSAPLSWPEPSARTTASVSQMAPRALLTRYAPVNQPRVYSQEHQQRNMLFVGRRAFKSCRLA